MTTAYRKRGVTVRIERSSRGKSTIELTEAGEAWFEAGTFFAKSSMDRDRLRPFGSRSAASFARRLESAIRPPIEIERYIVMQGAAEHEIDGIEWREHFARVHVSLIDRSRRARMTFDLGGASFDDIDVHPLGVEVREAVKSGPLTRLMLPPHVAAALWPALLSVAAEGKFERRGFRIRQRPHPEFALDGVGAPIGDAVMFDAERPGPLEPWPNYYRPSYRTPPARAPFHLAAECDGERAETDATVAGLANSVAIDGRKIAAEFVYGTTVLEMTLSLSEWLRRIEWIGDAAGWFPFGSGSWGASAILRVDDLKKSQYRTSSFPG